ncbi:MAG: bifunctional glycosyltransferase family 2 protein/CDP-glycerol:glycerophosphate glycerophosphotransferase [Lachnospiraceae bacterium]|nr:bifunctional glycosyltransferase family 2 protein/CDP-glycerol:glycerophosphate glycerophosphotransferase [Lachnospiraceae bacterium]
MKLSIIIPYYRGEQYLRDCLAGIREGGYEDVEVIVCDDDPMDPLGTAASRNRGLERCSGDLVLFLDSDDYFLPGDIGRAVNSAERFPDSVIVLNLRGTFYCRDAVIEKRVPESYFDMEIPMAMRAVGLIIPRKLISQKRFPERFRYYSELTFMTELSEAAEFVRVSDISYYKRIHNDPINCPSLSQEESPVRIGQFCSSFYDANKLGKKAGLQNLALCAGYFFEKCLTGDNGPKGLGRSERLKRDDCAAVQKALEGIDIGVIKNMPDKGQKKIIEALRNGDMGKAQKIANRIVFKKKKKGLFGSKDQWRLLFYRKLALRMRVRKDMIFFESFNGDLYGDSPRYIYEKYIENAYDRKFVWSIKKKGRKAIPGSHRCVKPGTLRYMFALARAGILVSNMRQPSWYVKRSGQFFFETWHGTPLKRLVFDMEEVYTASPGYKKIFYDQSRKWDYLLSGNTYSTDIFEHAFMMPKERIVQLGYPRNDRLKASADESVKRNLREKLGLPADKKIILYAPTWRDNKFRGSGDYEMKLPFDKDFIKKVPDCFFMLRMHYFVSETDGVGGVFGDNAVDMSGYDDINDLYLASDMLITDYSSVFFDYALLERPIIFYAYDEDEYKGELRGLYFDMESYCPGPVVRTQDELAGALNMDPDRFGPYLERYKATGDFFTGPDDAKASQRAVEFIEEKYGSVASEEKRYD